MNSRKNFWDVLDDYWRETNLPSQKDVMQQMSRDIIEHKQAISVLAKLLVKEIARADGVGQMDVIERTRWYEATRAHLAGELCTIPSEDRYQEVKSAVETALFVIMCGDL